MKSLFNLFFVNWSLVLKYYDKLLNMLNGIETKVEEVDVIEINNLIKKLTVEHTELNKKIELLFKFLESPESNHAYDITELNEQYVHMSNYANVLERRISLLKQRLNQDI